MLMSQQSKEKLNELLRMTFDFNAFADNIAYNLGFYHFPRTEALFHEAYAHHFPEIADEVSNLMIKLDARPVRLGLETHEHDYDGDIVAMFEDNYEHALKYRQAIIDTISLAEFNDDYEVKIAMEEFLVAFTPYLKQAEAWKTLSVRYKENAKSFDARIDKITSFIDSPDADDDDDDDD